MLSRFSRLRGSRRTGRFLWFGVLGALVCTAGAYGDRLTASAGQTVPPSPVRQWYVSPRGSAANSGTPASPWSLDHALGCAAGSILPGDVVNIRGGTYRRDPSQSPFTLTCGGGLRRAVVFRAYPGERPVLDGAMQNLAWEALPGNHSGHNVFRSTGSYAHLNADHFGGFIVFPPSVPSSPSSVGAMTLVVHGQGGMSNGNVPDLVSDVHNQANLPKGIAKVQAATAAGGGFHAELNGVYSSAGVATLPEPAYVRGTWNIPALVTVTGTGPDGATESESSSVPSRSFDGARLFRTITGISFNAPVKGMSFGTHGVRRYVGPGLAYDSADGRIYIRLDNSTTQAQYGRPVVQIPNPNPSVHDLRIAPVNSIGLLVLAQNVVVEGLEINNFGVGIQTAGTQGVSASRVTFKNLDIRPVRHGARLGNATRIVFADCRFHARMPSERFWMAYSDVKGSEPPADNTRKTAVDLGRATYVDIVRSEFNEFFDAILSEPATLELTGHHIRLLNNVFRQSWDDAWQMPYGHHHVEIGYNKFLGAGLSRDGSGSKREFGNPFPGTIWIHHNVFDPRSEPIFWLRFPATLDNGDLPPNTTDGMFDAIPISAHDLQKFGDNGYRFPWKFYYNTVVWKNPLPDNGLGILALEHPAGLDPGAPHEVYNNIFVDDSPNAHPLGRDFTAHTGHEMYDGNIYSGWGTAPTLRSLYRFVHLSPDQVPTSTNPIDGDMASPPLTGPEALRRHPDVLRDSKLYAIPSFGTLGHEGWEASSHSEDGVEIDALGRPTNCSWCGSGAVNLTGSQSWPGTGTYEPWRGAVQPQ